MNGGLSSRSQISYSVICGACQSSLAAFQSACVLLKLNMVELFCHPEKTLTSIYDLCHAREDRHFNS